MEKVSFKICQRDYSLKTDENPEMITKLARQLENSIGYVARIARGTTEVEITTLAAMIQICEIQSELNKQREALEQIKLQLEETDKKAKSGIQALSAEIAKKDSEINNLKASVEELSSVIKEKERVIEQADKNTEDKIKEMTDKFTQKENELNNALTAALGDCEQKGNLLKEIDGKLAETERQLKEHREKSAELNAQAENKLKEENQRLEAEITKLKEMAQSAETQFEQLAAVKDEESNRLRLRVQEYESELKDITAKQEMEIEAVYEEHEKECKLIDEKREKELNEIKADYEKRIGEILKQVEDQKLETEKIRKTLSNYEDTFDMYVRNKTAELKQAQEEAEAAKARNAELEKQLAKVGDVQMKLC